MNLRISPFLNTRHLSFKAPMGGGDTDISSRTELEIAYDELMDSFERYEEAVDKRNQNKDIKDEPKTDKTKKSR